MKTAEIIEVLDRLDALDRGAEAVRRAPLSLEQQIASLKADVASAAAVFHAAPWSQRSGLRAMACALWPKDVIRFEETQIRQRAAADPREPLDGATRIARLAMLTAERDQLLEQLSPDALTALTNAAGVAHGALRGVREQFEQLQARVDRLAAAIAVQSEERERRRTAPRQRVGYWQDGQPPPVLSADDQADAADAEQAREEAIELERNRVGLAAVEAEANQTAQRWRDIAQLASRYETWLRRKPIPQMAAHPQVAEEVRS